MYPDKYYISTSELSKIIPDLYLSNKSLPNGASKYYEYLKVLDYVKEHIVKVDEKLLMTLEEVGLEINEQNINILISDILSLEIDKERFRYDGWPGHKKNKFSEDEFDKKYHRLKKMELETTKGKPFFIIEVDEEKISYKPQNGKKDIIKKEYMMYYYCYAQKHTIRNESYIIPICEHLFELSPNK